MAVFTPVNALEIKLRELITNDHTPVWSFYTPLAAAPLWVIVRNHPELDGSDRVAPPGQNPELCVFSGPKGSAVGLYTSRARVQAVFDQWKISPQEWTMVSAPGYQLIKLVSTFAEEELWINCGLKECQYHVDGDFVELILEKGEPEYEKPEQTGRQMYLDSTAEAEEHLTPLREFLAKQPKVRAAWIYRQQNEKPMPASCKSYEVGLVMDDPADKSLLKEVGTMVKALTPVEMEWATGVMMADDSSLRNLSKQKPPFYARADFLKE